MTRPLSSPPLNTPEPAAQESVGDAVLRRDDVSILRGEVVSGGGRVPVALINSACDAAHDCGVEPRDLQRAAASLWRAPVRARSRQSAA